MERKGGKRSGSKGEKDYILRDKSKRENDIKDEAVKRFENGGKEVKATISS